MKSKIIALALFAFTAAAVTLLPTHRDADAVTQTQQLVIPANQSALIEVVFVLDTTGSMSGLIQAAKEKIWSIASTMASADPAPQIRMGLVAYRDRGDAYVTRVVDLSADLDSMYATLMDFKAQGGGDGPESVNQALNDAVEKVGWSQDPNAYKVVFLVGDAPPHMDYQDDVKYPETAASAKQKGIVINTVQCGQDGSTTSQWQRIAQLGQGDYFQVEQGGGAVAIATPFDKELASLSAELDKTRLYYGSKEEKAKQRKKLDAAAKLNSAASPESRARRAAFNTSKSGEANFLGEGELVDDVVSGKVDLADIEREKLPAPMQAMAPAAQQTLITETAQHRDELKRQIKELSEQRADFLAKKVEERGGAEDSLDHKVFSAVREQAGKKGLKYEAGAVKY